MGLGVGVMSSLGTSLGVTRHSIFAKDFDGSDQSITSNVSTIEAIAECVRTDITEFSFAVWVKMHTTSASCTLFKLGNTSGTTNQIICVYHAYHNEFRFSPKFGNTAVILNGGATNADGDSYENDGLWHLLVGTISKTQDKQVFYIDAVLKEEIDDVETLDEAINYFAIAQNGADGAYFNGEMDEFCMWEKALTVNDVADLYNARATSGDRIVDITQHETLSEGLILYHKFEEQSGTLAINHAKITEGAELVPSVAGIVNVGGGTITQISGNSYSSTSDGTSGSAIRPKLNLNLTAGKRYKLTITPTGTISGTVNFDFYDGSSYLFQDYDFTTTKEIYFIDNGSVFGSFDGTQTYNISSFTVSVKEITGAEATEGDELVTNGDFATDTDWTKGTGWSISGGTANCIGGEGSLNLTQVALETAKTYTVTYTVSNYSAGTIHPVMGGWTHGTYQSSNGTYTEAISNNHGSANTTFYMQGKSGFVGSIDNVSVKEYTGHGIYVNAPATVISTI